MSFTGWIELAGRFMEVLGVSTIVVGTVLVTWQFLGLRRAGTPGQVLYKTYRAGLAQAILLGLEFLVAGDIIRTVAVEPTLSNVGVLAVIVLIRTVLSISLQLEIEGRWPWQASAIPVSGTAPED